MLARCTSSLDLHMLIVPYWYLFRTLLVPKVATSALCCSTQARRPGSTDCLNHVLLYLYTSCNPRPLFCPSLISLIVSVDIMQHVYICNTFTHLQKALQTTARLLLCARLEVSKLSRCFKSAETLWLTTQGGGRLPTGSLSMHSGL